MKTNPTAAEIAQFTATVRKAGKKWVHQLLDHTGEVIATRKTDSEVPYSAACIIVVTRASRLAFLKRELAKYGSRSQSVAKNYCKDIAAVEADIASGADANEFLAREVSWTRGAGSAGFSRFIARLVPATSI
jgi:hypothetical protein